MEVSSAFVETATGVEQRGESEDSGEERHSSSQPIDDQDDAERGRPVAEGVDAQQSVVGEQRQPCGEHYQQAAGQQPDGPLEGQSFARHLQQRGGKGEQDRKDRRMRVHRGSFAAST